MKNSFISKDDVNDFIDSIGKENKVFINTEEINQKNSQTQVKDKPKEIDKSRATIVTVSKFKESKYRFIIVVTYCMLSMANSANWVTYATIANNFQKYYDITTLAVDIFSILYMIMYPLVTFPAGYLVDNISMRIGLVAGAGLTLAGVTLKAYTSYSLVLAYTGQLCCAIAQPLILSTPGKLTSNWFRPDKRVLFTTLCCLANTIGVIYGFIQPTFFYDPVEDNKKKFLDHTNSYLLMNAFITGGMCLPCIFFMKDKPKHPPSQSQQEKVNMPFFESIKTLMKNKSFIILLICNTGIVGYFNIYGTIINQYFEGYGLNANQTSVLGAVANFSGIIGSIIFSIVIDKIRSYKKIFVIISGVAVIIHYFLTLFLELYPKQSYIICIVLWTLATICIVPVFTISMDFVCELTYPVGESISTGIMMSSNQISGIIGIIVYYELQEHLGRFKYLVNIFNGLYLLIAWISIMFLEEKLLRKAQDDLGETVIYEDNEVNLNEGAGKKWSDKNDLTQKLVLNNPSSTSESQIGTGKTN